MKHKNSLKKFVRKRVILFTIGKNIGLIHHIAKKAIKGLIKKFTESKRYRNND